MRSQLIVRTRGGFVDPCFQQGCFERAVWAESSMAKRVRRALMSNAYWCGSESSNEGKWVVITANTWFRDEEIRSVASFLARREIASMTWLLRCRSEDWWYLCQKLRTVREPRRMLFTQGRLSQQAGGPKSHGLDGTRRSPALSAIAKTSATSWSHHRSLALLITSLMACATSTLLTIELPMIATCTSEGQVEMRGTCVIAAACRRWFQGVASLSRASSPAFRLDFILCTTAC